MITRIRYKEENGVMTSVTPLLAKTMMVKVVINLIEMSFVVYDDEGLPISGGSTTSKQKILNEVKKEIKNLGVLFHDEIRPRKIKFSKNLSEKMLEGEDISVTDSNLVSN